VTIEPGSDGWVLCREPIPAERVRLLHADRPPEGRELCSVWLSFVSSRLSVDEMSALVGIAPDDVGDGEETDASPGAATHAGRSRAANATRRSGVNAESASWRLDIDAAALLDRIGAEIAISVG
jgi:hypothetical protein